MDKFCKALKRATVSLLSGVLYACKVNLRNAANALLIVLPYGMLWLGSHVQPDPVYLLIPAGVLVLAYYLKEVANQYGCGDRFPVPERRFTKVDPDGEVSIERDRLQEMILYVGEVEDWLKLKGLQND